MTVTNITRMTFSQETEQEAIKGFREKKDWVILCEDTKYITFELKREYANLPTTISM